MNINVRRLSKERMANFEKASGKVIDTSKLRHMFSGKDTIDLAKAKNWLELAAAERITIDPMCQSRGENKQLLKLSSVFKNVEKYKPGTLFLHKGKLYTEEKVPSGVRTDIDAVIEDPNYIVVLSLKTTQSNAYKGGGSQNNSFDQLVDLIDNAPLKAAKGKLWLGLYVSGGFWTESREKYKTYKAKYPTTCFNILKQYAKDKKCIVFTDSDLPSKRITFYQKFIKNKL